MAISAVQTRNVETPRPGLGAAPAAADHWECPQTSGHQTRGGPCAATMRVV